jgi:hypothetical protein
MRRGFVAIILAVGALLLLACMGLFAPIEFLAVITIGWIWYLARTLPVIQVAWAGVATGALCLTLVAIGSHYFLAWIYPHVRWPGEGYESGVIRWKWRWTGSFVAGIVLLFVAGLATVGVTHQLGWLLTSREPLFVREGGARAAAWRAQSQNNLKFIGLAVGLYERVHETFPPGGTFDQTGRPLQSWQAMILPDLDQKALYQRIQCDVAWNDFRNRPAFQTELMVYLRPGIPVTKNAAGYALSHYAANAHMLGGDHPRTLRDVADGAAVTLLAGEVVADFKPWGDPTNWRDPSLGLNKSPRGFGSLSAGGVSFLMVDGSVRFIKNTIDPRVLKSLATPSGGEKVGSDQY